MNILIYQTPSGSEPFVEWIESLDKSINVKIRKRIARLETGHFGDCKCLGNNIYELRFFFGSGYRVYFGMQEQTIVMLLCGGDKSSQKNDVEKAIKYWEAIKNEIISHIQH